MAESWPQIWTKRLADKPELAEKSNFGMVPSLAPMMAGGAISPAMLELANPTTKPQRELFVGNLPDGVTEAMILDFLNTAIIGAQLITMGAGNPVVTVRMNSNRFAFAEFRCADETTNAMALNGLTMAGNALQFQRPNAYVPPGGGAAQPMMVPGLGLVGGAAAGPAEVPTKVIQLCNMTNADELKDDEEASFIQEDVVEECEAKGGKVLNVEIPRPPTDGTPCPKCVGLIYVHFEELEAAKKAQGVLNGYASTRTSTRTRTRTSTRTRARAAPSFPHPPSPSPSPSTSSSPSPLACRVAATDAAACRACTLHRAVLRVLRRGACAGGLQARIQRPDGGGQVLPGGQVQRQGTRGPAPPGPLPHARTRTRSITRARPGMRT